MRRSSRDPDLIGIIAAVALGAMPVAARLWPMGPAQQRSAVLALVLGLAVGLVGSLAPPLVVRVTAWVAIAGAGSLLASSEVGRVPIPLAVVAAAIAHRTLGVWPPSPRPGRLRGAPLALVPLVGFGAAWIASGSNVVAAALLGASLGVIGVYLLAGPRDVPPASNLERRFAVVDGGVRYPLRVLHIRGAKAIRAVADAVVELPVHLAARADGRLRARVRDGFGRSSAAVGRRRRRCSHRLRSAWPQVRIPLLLGAVVAILSIPMFWRLVVDQSVTIRGTNDINSGIPRIHGIEFWPPVMTVAHPVWFTLQRILTIPLSDAVAVTLVGSLSVGGTVYVLVLWGRSRWDERAPLSWPLAGAFGLSYVFLESVAVFIPRTEDIFGRYSFAGSFARGPGYLALHQWATPTIVMVTGFSFWSFALLQQVVAEADRSGEAVRRRRWRLCILTIFTTLLLPATTLVLVPGMALLLLFTRRLWTPAFFAYVRWFAVPGTAIVLAEVAFLSSKVSEFEQATWVWRPFWVFQYYGLDRPALYAIYLLMVVCLWAGGMRYVRDRAVSLAFLSMVVGIFPFVFLEQTTVASIPDGDLGVPPLMAMWLLFMSSLRFLLIEAQAWWRRPERSAARTPGWVVAGAIVLLAMLAAGIVDFLGAAGVVKET